MKKFLAYMAKEALVHSIIIIVFLALFVTAMSAVTMRSSTEFREDLLSWNRLQVLVYSGAAVLGINLFIKVCGYRKREN